MIFSEPYYKRSVLRMLNVIKKLPVLTIFGIFKDPEPVPDFVPIRIRSQEKKAFRIRTKGPGSETLPSNE